MAEWTPEAIDYLDAYLRQVAVLARSQGDDAEEIVSELREHIKREAEEKDDALVTLVLLRKTLAIVGTPEQVTAVESPLSASWRDRNQARTSQIKPDMLPTVTIQMKPLTKGFKHRLITIVTCVGVLYVLAVLASIALPYLSRLR